MKIDELDPEAGIARISVDKRLAFKMAHLRFAFADTNLSEGAIPQAEKVFRQENPNACFLVRSGVAKEWGWYLYEDSQHLFVDFLKDEQKLSGIESNFSFLMGMSCGKSRVRKETIEINFGTRTQEFSVKELERLKECVEKEFVLLRDEIARLKKTSSKIAKIPSPKKVFRVPAVTRKAA